MKKKRLMRYGITAGIGLVLVFLVFLLRDGFSKELSVTEHFRFLSDAFFIPGVLLFGVGMLVFLSGVGMFDILGYSIGLFFRIRRTSKHESYVEYKERKNLQGTKPCAFLMLTGLGFIVVGALFTALYYV